MGGGCFWGKLHLEDGSLKLVFSDSEYWMVANDGTRVEKWSARSFALGKVVEELVWRTDQPSILRRWGGSRLIREDPFMPASILVSSCETPGLFVKVS